MEDQIVNSIIYKHKLIKDVMMNHRWFVLFVNKDFIQIMMGIALLVQFKIALNVLQLIYVHPVMKGFIYFQVN